MNMLTLGKQADSWGLTLWHHLGGRPTGFLFAACS